MTPILQQLTLHSSGLLGLFSHYFGLDFSRNDAMNSFLENSELYWFVQDNHNSKDKSEQVIQLQEGFAKKALDSNKTVGKIVKSSFPLDLEFKELKLADGHTLTLTLRLWIHVTDPVRFYKMHASRLHNVTALESQSLHDSWEAPFYNVIQVEAHKADVSNWQSVLSEPTLTVALQNFYFAPMATKYVDGTVLDSVESINGSSPSLIKQMEAEAEALKRKEKEAKSEEERKKRAEERRLKELAIEEEKNKIAARKLELEIIEAKKRAKQEEIEKILLANKNKWLSLHDSEKLIALHFSDVMKTQAQSHSIELVNTAIVKSDVHIQGIVAQWNTLKKGQSLGFSFTAPMSGYITILNLGTSGKMTVLIPNEMTGTNTSAVKAQRGIRYEFPQSFLLGLDDDVFVEQDSSGLEGIYTLITPEPLFQMERTDQLESLLQIPYETVTRLLEQLQALPTDSWSAGCLEFQVIK